MTSPTQVTELNRGARLCAPLDPPLPALDADDLAPMVVMRSPNGVRGCIAERNVAALKRLKWRVESEALP